jgi:hypothetical protein
MSDIATGAAAPVGCTFASGHSMLMNWTRLSTGFRLRITDAPVAITLYTISSL